MGGKASRQVNQQAWMRSPALTTPLEGGWFVSAVLVTGVNGIKIVMFLGEAQSVALA